MKSIIFLSCIALACISSCVAYDLMVGTSYNSHLTWQQKVYYTNIPFMKRVKELFYTDPAQQIIKGVIAREGSHTTGTAYITAGGVGFSYVNIRFKSARGDAIDYSVEIYV